MARKPSASLLCGENAVAWARTQAEYYHRGQFRRDGETPYIKHPEAVADAVTSWQAKCVAWLHDVLEDTACTEMWLRKCLHGTIVDAVVALTKKDGEDYEEYIARVTDTPYAAAVKIADIQHNLSDNPTKKQRAKYEKALNILVSDVSKAANKPNIREAVQALLVNRHEAKLKFTYCFQGCDPMGFPLPCYADITMTVHDIVNWYRLLRMPNAWDVDVLTRFLDTTDYWVQVGF
jgi:hypothetical protein